MKIITTRNELAEVLEEYRVKGQTLGFVPTMGALHAGHLSLISASKQENDLTVCSIFVNPTQFTDARDLELYPRPVESDTLMLQAQGVDVLFMPAAAEMYSPDEHWEIDLGGIDAMLEGEFRPGHFQGVTQVVYKLFMLVKPDIAYFGQKDFQQFRVIDRMVDLQGLSISLVRCPIIREADGLAMSSRNAQLSPEMREAAVLISRALFAAEADQAHFTVAETISRALEILGESPLLTPEYFAIVDDQTLMPVGEWTDSESIIALTAVKAGTTRLIDNQYLRQVDFYS